MAIETRVQATTLKTKVERPKAEGYNIRVGDLWFRTVAGPNTPIQIITKDSLADRMQNRSGNIHENVLDIGMAWSRTDLSGGEGLDWDPREIALDAGQASLDPIRYWDSEGIDNRRPEVQGEQYSLKLARTLQAWGGTLVDPKDITTSNTYIWVADGAVISWYDSWTNLTPTATDTLPSPVIALAAAPNDTVMATLENGNVYALKSYPTEIVFSQVYGDQGVLDLAAQGVWYVSGRFIVSAFDDVDSASLFALEWDGTSAWTQVPIDTSSAPFWSVVESGPAVVAACGDGTVRTYTPDNANDGDMSLHPRARTTMPEGEIPILLGSNSGVLLIMTTADTDQADRQDVRVYQAEVLDSRFDFVVGQLQLRREWDAVEHEPLVTRNMTNTRDEIFFFVKENVNNSGIYQEALWRYDVVTTGLTRVVYAEVDVNLNAIVIFDSIAGAINFTTPGILLSDPDFVQAAGYMIFPNITFGLNTPITWIATIVEAQDLVDSGGQVELWRSTDPQAILDPEDPSWVLIQRLSSQGGSNLEVPMNNLKSRTIALMLRMFGSEGNTISPQVTRIAIRGIPAHRDFIMQVPFDISDTLSVPGRSPQRIPGMGNETHERVLNLVGDSVEAFLIDPFIHFTGVVNNISEPIEYVSDRGSVTRYVFVEFRGQRTSGTATVPATGDDGIGLGLLGIATVGIGQTEGT